MWATFHASSLERWKALQRAEFLPNFSGSLRGRLARSSGHHFLRKSGLEMYPFRKSSATCLGLRLSPSGRREKACKPSRGSSPPV